MTALALEADRVMTGGNLRRLPLAASGKPYAGSLLSMNTTGFADVLSAGRPFAGICRTTIPSANAPTTAGDIEVEAVCGLFTIAITLSGAAAADALKRRKVYASDDNTFTFTPTGNTLIGEAFGYDSAASKLLVLCRTADSVGTGGPCPLGIETLADGNATLTVAQLDKLLIITPGAGRTLTLPPAADCAGRCFTIKSLAAQTVTLTGNASENIDGANTSALMTAANEVQTIMSSGTAWYCLNGPLA